MFLKSRGTQLISLLSYLILKFSLPTTTAHGLGPESGLLNKAPSKPKLLDNTKDSTANPLPLGLPHQVLIEIKIAGHKYNCGGVIISEDFILTAASCFVYGGKKVGRQRVMVMGGVMDKSKSSDNLQGSYAWKIVTHKKFNEALKDYDVALVQLEEPFELDPFYGVDSVRVADRKLIVQGKALVSGWGDEAVKDFDDHDDKEKELTVDPPDFDNEEEEEKMEKGGKPPNILKGTYVDLVDREECQRSFEEAGVPNVFLTERQRCSFSRKETFHPGQGDLGGPLTCFTENAEEEPVLCGLITSGSKGGRSGSSEGVREPRVYVNLQDEELNRWIVNNAWLPHDENSLP